MATSETFHVALRVGPATLRLSKGCIAEVNIVSTAQVEVVYRVFCSVERLDLRHSELCRKKEVQHPSCEWGFGLLYQGVHGDWSSALYCFLHVAHFLLDVPEPLLPQPLLCLLLIKDGPISFVVLPCLSSLRSFLGGW